MTLCLPVRGTQAEKLSARDAAWRSQIRWGALRQLNSVGRRRVRAQLTAALRTWWLAALGAGQREQRQVVLAHKEKLRNMEKALAIATQLAAEHNNRVCVAGAAACVCLIVPALAALPPVLRYHRLSPSTTSRRRELPPGTGLLCQVFCSGWSPSISWTRRPVPSSSWRS